MVDLEKLIADDLAIMLDLNPAEVLKALSFALKSRELYLEFDRPEAEIAEGDLVAN